jgi:hypothetical protein
MDIQKMVDAMSASWRDERSKYHLTLGALIKELEQLAPETPVILSDAEGSYPGRAISYRGYYSDLCFVPTSDHTTVGTLLATARTALGDTFEGYKGGDYVMEANTPLWIDEYGCANGRAVMGLAMINGTAVLQIKQVD